MRKTFRRKVVWGPLSDARVVPSSIRRSIGWAAISMTRNTQTRRLTNSNAIFIGYQFTNSLERRELELQHLVRLPPGTTGSPRFWQSLFRRESTGPRRQKKKKKERVSLLILRQTWKMVIERTNNVPMIMVTNKWMERQMVGQGEERSTTKLLEHFQTFLTNSHSTSKESTNKIIRQQIKQTNKIGVEKWKY